VIRQDRFVDHLDGAEKAGEAFGRGDEASLR
jgi:hypothetical protein